MDNKYLLIYPENINNIYNNEHRFYQKFYNNNSNNIIFFDKILSTGKVYTKDLYFNKKSLKKYFFGDSLVIPGNQNNELSIRFSFNTNSLFKPYKFLDNYYKGSDSVYEEYYDIPVQELNKTGLDDNDFIKLTILLYVSIEDFHNTIVPNLSFDIESNGNSVEIIETLKINIINLLTGEPYGDIPNSFSLNIGSEVEDLKLDILINLANKGYEDLTTHEYRAMNVPDNHTLTNYKSGIDYAFMNDKYLQLLALYNVILMSKGNIRSLKGIINWFGYDSSKVLKVVRKWNPLINNFWSEDYDLGVMRKTEKYFETPLNQILGGNSDKRNSFETFGTTNLYNIILEDKDLENGNNFHLDKTLRWRVYLLSLFLESHFLPIHIGIDNASVRSDFKEESEKIEDGLTRVLNISNHYYSNVNSFFNNNNTGKNNNKNIPNLSIDKSKNPNSGNGNGNNNDKEEDLNKKPSDSLIEKYKKPDNKNNKQNFILNIPISDINYHLVYFNDKPNNNIDLQVSPDKILKKYLNYYFSGGLIGTPLNLSNNLSNNIRSIQFYTEDYSENITNIYSFFDPNKNYLFINHRTKYIHITLDSGLTFEYITNFPSKEDISYKLLSNHIQVKYSDGIIDRTSDKYKQITIKQTIDKFIEVFGFDFKKYVNSKTKYTYFKNIPDKYLIDIYKSNNDFSLERPNDNLMDIYNDTSKIFSVAHLNWFDKLDNISKNKNNTLILIYFKNFLVGNSNNPNNNHLEYQIQNLIFPNKENNKNSIYTTGIILYQPGIYDITLTGIIDGIPINYKHSFKIWHS